MVQLNYRESRIGGDQLTTGLLELIDTGAIMVGERMPSVLEMSMKWTVNPNRLRRSYEKLVQMGILLMQNGEYYVVRNVSSVPGQKEQLLADFDKFAKQLLKMSMDAEELELRLKMIENEEIIGD